MCWQFGWDQWNEKQVKSRTQKYFSIIDFLFVILFSLPISIQSKIRADEKHLMGSRTSANVRTETSQHRNTKRCGNNKTEDRSLFVYYVK